MFARLSAAVGDAAALAECERLSPRRSRFVRSWLRPLEAMVRKIVLMEALALARQPEAPRAQSAARTPPSKRARAPRQRRVAFRLWPRQRWSVGPRIRSLGPPMRVIEINRDRARLALARHLANVRPCARMPEAQRLAGRIAALERVIDKPRAAIRRLARKLRATPKLAIKLACARPPRARRYDDPELAETNMRVFAAARTFLDSS